MGKVRVRMGRIRAQVISRAVAFQNMPKAPKVFEVLVSLPCRGVQVMKNGIELLGFDDSQKLRLVYAAMFRNGCYRCTAEKAAKHGGGKRTRCRIYDELEASRRAR